VHRDVRTVPELPPRSAYLRRGRAGEPRVVALAGQCTHQGCPTRFVEASRKFICPCHGGVFGFDGKPEGGPVVRSLAPWDARVHDGNVYLAPAPASRPLTG
jgi:Rieske Fe-S protein